MSQNQRLLAYLKSHKRGITQGEAHIHLGIQRLSERIAEIEGNRWWNSTKWLTDNRICFHAITRTREKVKGRYGVATVTRYKLG